jgi:DNA-binding NtrC family response regulator
MVSILLVEDDADILPLLEHVLGEEDYDVTTAETVASSIALLDAQRFDLAICDVNLPDGSGLAIADKAKASGVKTLVVTGHGLSLKPGTLAAYDYLLKPIRIVELLTAVERRLAKEDGDAEAVPGRW